jgi:hypothetical protein
MGAVGGQGEHLIARTPQRWWPQRPTTLTSALSSKALQCNLWYTLHWWVSQERYGHPWLVAFVLTHHTKMRMLPVKGVCSFVIFDGDFLFSARQFSPLEAANSQFWLRSCMHKLFPRATTLPKPQGRGIIIANSIPQGSILIKKLLNKIVEGGGFW